MIKYSFHSDIIEYGIKTQTNIFNGCFNRKSALKNNLKIPSAEVVCCMFCYHFLTNGIIGANSVDPDQTALTGANSVIQEQTDLDLHCLTKGF